MDLGDYGAIYHSPTVEKDIRDFFLAERKRLKLTQEDVATAGGITQSMVSRIERDKPYDPGLAVFVKAVRGLEMTPAEFFTKFESRDMTWPTKSTGLQTQVLNKANDSHEDEGVLPRVDHAAVSSSSSVSTTDLERIVRAVVRGFRDAPTTDERTTDSRTDRSDRAASSRRRRR